MQYIIQYNSSDGIIDAIHLMLLFDVMYHSI